MSPVAVNTLLISNIPCQFCINLNIFHGGIEEKTGVGVFFEHSVEWQPTIIKNINTERERETIITQTADKA